jgi:endonuclease/exonuclease/phosphatase family metal-dependent hydrolase
MIHSTFARALALGAALVTAMAGSAAAQTASNGDIVLHAKSAAVMSGAWSLIGDATAADGLRLANPDRGAAKISTALAAPVDFVELKFTAEAGRAYHLWIRGKADGNTWTNDSVYVQFSGSQTAAGSAAYRIGTTSAVMYSVEEGSNAGLSGWGWQDNGYGIGVLGDPIYFNGAAQTIRVQAREDGVSIDQIVLSPVTYYTKAPGAAKNDTTILAESGGTATTDGSGALTTSTTDAGTFAWTSFANTSASGATLTKMNGCTGCSDAGAVSQQSMTAGSVSFTVSPGARVVAGLGTDRSSNTSYAFNYAFSFGGGSGFEIREGGVYRTEGTFASSDVFKVAVEGTTVKYYRNATLVYTSKVPVPGALVVDTTLMTVGASVKVVGFSANGTTTTTPPADTGDTGDTSTTGTATLGWTSVVKATASGSTISKLSGCGDCADAGGVGNQAFTTGAVSFTVLPGTRLLAGLGTDRSSNTSYTFNYAFSFGGGSTWEIREAGAYRAEGSFSSSDVFKITADGTTVRYYRNGALVYTSKASIPGALVVDTTLVSIGASVRVTGFSATSTGTGTTGSETIEPPPPSTTGAVSLRVLQWNTRHGGFGTDGVYDTNRVADWIVAMKPDVVMLNEIEKFTGWGNQDQPLVYKNLLQQKTGKTWYYTFAQEFGNWSSNGKGNLILSTYPLSYTTQYELVHNYDRSIALATITVNARPITLICTHLDPYDQALRLVQAKEVTGWAAPQPENRIITGDMNAWPDQTSIGHFNTLYYDSWTVALSKGTATAFPGNNGETKNGRIDYIFYSKGSSNLTVKSSQVYDTRDANGVMPSDHRPVVTTFEVK